MDAINKFLGLQQPVFSETQETQTSPEQAPQHVSSTGIGSAPDAFENFQASPFDSIDLTTPMTTERDGITAPGPLAVTLEASSLFDVLTADANPSPLTGGTGGVTDQIASVALNPQPLPPKPPGDPDPPFNPVADPFSSVALNPQPLPPKPPGDPDPPFAPGRFGDALSQTVLSEPDLSGLSETMDDRAKNAFAELPSAEIATKVEAIKTPESEAVSQMITTLKSYFQPLAAYKERFHEVMKEIFDLPVYKNPRPPGSSTNYFNYSAEKAEALRQRALAGDYRWLPQVQFVPGSSVKGNGGYSPRPPGTVYLNDALIKDPERAADAFIRATGHQLLLLTMEPPEMLGGYFEGAERFRRTLTGKPPVSDPPTGYYYYYPPEGGGRIYVDGV